MCKDIRMEVTDTTRGGGVEGVALIMELSKLMSMLNIILTFNNSEQLSYHVTNSTGTRACPITKKFTKATQHGNVLPASLLEPISHKKTFVLNKGINVW